MTIAILVLSALSALGSLLAAGTLMLICSVTCIETHNEKEAAAYQKTTVKNKNLNGEN